MGMKDHPLCRMINLYCAGYKAAREDNLDLSNMAFHKKYGLQIQTPESWNTIECIHAVLEDVADCCGEKLVVIFSSTSFYLTLYGVLGDIQYLSWHEIFTGMHIAQSDIRYIQKVKNVLAEADIVFFVDPPNIPEVIDQVHGLTDGGLIILS